MKRSVATGSPLAAYCYLFDLRNVPGFAELGNNWPENWQQQLSTV